MPREVVGKIPEFTSEEGEGEKEEVKETPAEEAVEEKETPSEPSTEEEPAEETKEETKEEELKPPEEELSEDTTEVDELAKKEKERDKLIGQVEGLATTRDKLLGEITGLRGDRRELKEKELIKVEKEIKDELKDVNPDDVVIIEKILKSRGYMSKDEAQKMFYDSIKQQELNKFLDKYPEYKPENDPSDVNWKTLQSELTDYRMPTDPHQVGRVLEKARRAIVKTSPSSERDTKAIKQRLKTASKGVVGIQRSSPQGQLTPEQIGELRRGGFSEEEIKEMDLS